MDALLYDLSIPAISSLQKQLSGQASLMQAVSVVFDPKYAFLIYSPIAFLLNKQMGKRLILTTVITEWLNMILKWLLHGERPYWYVHSSGHFDAKETPIQQFPITCELGPGHPSGHAMVTAAVWYIIFDTALQFYRTHLSTSDAATKHQRQASSGQASLSIWTLYALLLVTVSVSRVFLGCHFPHQCLVGAFLGLLVAKWVSSVSESKAAHFIGAAVFLMISVFSTYELLQWLGFDPSWTIKLATKHCIKREYIHLDTAPFFSVMRYCGFALGTGLGLMFPLRRYTRQVLILVAGDKKSSHSLSWFSFKILMALLMARLVDNFAYYTNPFLAYYPGAFLAYTLFSFAFVNL